MNIYQAYIREIATDEYETDDWRYFAWSFSELLELDKNLAQLLTENVFIKEKWSEISDEIKHSITDELLLLPYIDSHIQDKDALLQEVISIADNVLKANLFRSLADDYLEISSLPQSSLFLEDDLAVQFRTIDVDQLEGDDKDVFKELRLIENDLKKFKLNKDELLSILHKSGFKTNVRPKIASRIPIIKQVDFFDPTVYALIKANPELLKTLDWRIFEEMLADMLRTFGYSIELTRRTKDGGIDVIAIKSDRDFGHHKYILQAKRYTHSVQVSPVRELLYIHGEQKASKSCLATTSTFTKGAWELAEKHRWTLELKDREGILKWIDRIIEIKSS